MPEPVYTLRLPVHWGAMDALGHVNHAVYRTYVEQARIDCLASLAEARMRLVRVDHETDRPTALPEALRGQP